MILYIRKRSTTKINSLCIDSIWQLNNVQFSCDEYWGRGECMAHKMTGQRKIDTKREKKRLFTEQSQLAEKCTVFVFANKVKKCTFGKPADFHSRVFYVFFSLWIFFPLYFHPIYVAVSSFYLQFLCSTFCSSHSICWSYRFSRQSKLIFYFSIRWIYFT